MEIDKSKPRLSKKTDFLELIYMMMANPDGITLEEICDEFLVSRRTAERMRDAVLDSPLPIEELEPVGKIKRWGFRNFKNSEIICFSDREIAVMEAVKQEWKSICYKELDTIIDKMKALRKKK